MLTVLVDGVEPVVDDRFILKAIEQAAAREPLFGAAVMIGVDNNYGEVYRLVQCHGGRQTARVTACLQLLSFRQERSIGTPYHYRFRR